MSEAAPGIPDSPAFATPERAALAAALRDLIDAAMASEEIAAGTLTAVASEVTALTARLGTRASGPGYRPRSHGDYLPRSPIVGEASPLSPRLDWEIAEIDGRPGIEARGSFGAAYEGPPTYVHGGWLACAFDEVLGVAQSASGNPGMTANLSVDYRSPTPILRELVFRGWCERIDGRKIYTRGTVHHGDTLCAEASGLFIAMRPELFAKLLAMRDAPSQT